MSVEAKLEAIESKIGELESHDDLAALHYQKLG